MIRAQIGSDSVATSCGITVHTGSPVLALCRKLKTAGCDPRSPLEAYRGETLCLTIRSIGEAAGLQVGSHGGGFIQLKSGRSAPPMRLTAPSSLAGCAR